MGFDDLIADANWTTGVASIVVGVVSALLSNWLAWARFRWAHRLEDQTEAVLLELLRHPQYDMRSFKIIQGRVPLADEKLREALLRIGAVRFSKRETGEELWGLLAKHRDKVFGTRSGDPVN